MKFLIPFLILFFCPTFWSFSQNLDSIEHVLDSIQTQIDEVTIQAARMKEIRLKSVEGTVIFEGKKNGNCRFVKYSSKCSDK